MTPADAGRTRGAGGQSRRHLAVERLDRLANWHNACFMQGALKAWWLLLGLGAMASRSLPANACSCVDPWANELIVGDGVIPVNAGGVLWWYRNGV